jgi:alanine racemase
MRSYIDIDLKKIKINLTEIKKVNNKKIIAVIKSNAYGLGLIEIAKFLESENINYFAVATLEEAINLRKNNIKSQILVLEKNNSYKDYIKYNLIYCLYDLDSLKEINKLLLPIRIHIKFNTGLNRLGLDEKDIDELLKIAQIHKVKIEGVFTHVASVNSYEKQLEKFEFFAKKLSHIPNLLTHIDSSRFIDKTNFTNTIRIGLSLLTYKENALSLYAPIYKIKEVNKGELIGYNQEVSPSKGYVLTIPLGYADGWNFSRRTIGYIDGNKIQQIGRTCMDLMMFFSPNMIKSSTIEIIGEHIYLDYLSTLFEESKYVILATLNQRLERNYLK